MDEQNKSTKKTINIFWHPRWNGPDQPENMITVRDQGETRSYINVSRSSMIRLAKLSYQSGDVFGFSDGYGFVVKSTH